MSNLRTRILEFMAGLILMFVIILLAILASTLNGCCPRPRVSVNPVYEECEGPDWERCLPARNNFEEVGDRLNWGRSCPPERRHYYEEAR